MDTASGFSAKQRKAEAGWTGTVPENLSRFCEYVVAGLPKLSFEENRSSFARSRPIRCHHEGRDHQARDPTVNESRFDTSECFPFPKNVAPYVLHKGIQAVVSAASVFGHDGHTISINRYWFR